MKHALMVAGAVLAVVVGAAAQDRPQSDYSFIKGDGDCYVNATNERDMNTMSEMCDLLLPPDAFASINVDGSNVSLRVTSEAAQILNNSRILTYFAMAAFADLWEEYSGYKDVEISLRVTNRNRNGYLQTVTFARGVPARAGYSVNMAKR